MTTSVVEQLAAFSTSTLSDALDRLGIAGQVTGIYPVHGESRVFGRAFTIAYQPIGVDGGTVGDYIDDVPPGSVLVLDNGGRTDATVWGDILTLVASRRGIAGTVINGVCRDSSRSRELGYPLFSCGRWMRTGKDRVAMVSVDTPVNLGGVRVRPSDVVIGDSDGVVVVPAGHEDRVLALATQIETAEQSIRDRVLAGSRLDTARASGGYHTLQTREAGDTAAEENALMAEIVLGIGSSHTPQLSTMPEIWVDHADRDRRNPELVARDGEVHAFDDIESHPDWVVAESELTEQAWTEMYDRAQVALSTLAETLTSSGVDAVVVIGDDQEEMFLDDGKPAFAIYWGDTVTEHAPTPEEQAAMPEGLRAALWAAHGDEPETYPVPAALGKHLIESLVADEFDICQLREAPSGRSIGHAFTFVRRRLMGEKIIPILPIALNAYYPPNQPTPGRCYAFGQALRRAIESFPEPMKVAVVASGGLSHFVINQELDELVLDALARNDREALVSIPRNHLRSGTSEIMNWIAAGAAMPHMLMKVVDYFPAYRSTAGTGVGMAFAVWHLPE